MTDGIGNRVFRNVGSRISVNPALDPDICLGKRKDEVVLF